MLAEHGFNFFNSCAFSEGWDHLCYRQNSSRQESPNCESAAGYVLNNWLPPGTKLNLLYDSRLDERTAKRWHELSDNRGPTLVIVKQLDDNPLGERIMGGFTNLNWKSGLAGSGPVKGQAESFLFNLSPGAVSGFDARYSESPDRFPFRLNVYPNKV